MPRKQKAATKKVPKRTTTPTVVRTPEQELKYAYKYKYDGFVEDVEKVIKHIRATADDIESKLRWWKKRLAEETLENRPSYRQHGPGTKLALEILHELAWGVPNSGAHYLPREAAEFDAAWSALQALTPPETDDDA